MLDSQVDLLTWRPELNSMTGTKKTCRGVGKDTVSGRIMTEADFWIDLHVCLYEGVHV